MGRGRERADERRLQQRTPVADKEGRQPVRRGKNWMRKYVASL
jgi:hypothetical protein